MERLIDIERNQYVVLKLYCHGIYFLTECYIVLQLPKMPIRINGVNYFTVADLLKELDVTRQTLWRWRRERKVPSGHRFRNHHVVFDLEEVEMIKEYANRVEPIDDTSDNDSILRKD